MCPDFNGRKVCRSGMSDKELMISAGLYETDFVTGMQGYNLAAVLLFGKDEVIQSCVPGDVTDALCRKENLDRYDDRLIVKTNLIKSYELLMNFIAKHTPDKFALVDNVRASVRDLISREIVSNILVHRDFSSAFPAKVIIEKDWIRTENWCRARRQGNILEPEFTPYPKNPILARENVAQMFQCIYLIQEGIVNGNDPFLYGEKVKAYLRRSARPLAGFTVYPNPQEGYEEDVIIKSHR